MRLGGRELKECNIQTIVIPRGDGPPIVFKAHAILEPKRFNELCPRPKAPIRVKAGGERIPNLKDPRYQLSLDAWALRKTAWLIVETLRLGNPDLEWDTVDYDNPNTWEKYVNDLQNAGFSDAEISMIIDGCLQANALDNEKIEAARASFLASQEAEAAASLSSSLDSELSDTSSGEPANDLESVPLS